MSRVVGTILLAVASGALEIALVVLGAPILLLVAVGAAAFATGLLLGARSPVAIPVSVGLYLTAVVLGFVDFSPVGLALSGV
jgi:hypothetical protein